MWTNKTSNTAIALWLAAGMTVSSTANADLKIDNRSLTEPKSTEQVVSNTRNALDYFIEKCDWIDRKGNIHEKKKNGKINWFPEKKCVKLEKRQQARTELAELKSENEKWRTELAELKSENEKWRTELAELKSENEKWRTELAELKSENEQLDIDNAQWMDYNTQLSIKNAQLDRENAKLEIDRASRKAYIKQLKEEIKQLKIDIKTQASN